MSAAQDPSDTITAPAAGPAEGPGNGTTRSPLVEPAELAAELAGPRSPLLLDVRWTLAGGPDRAGYRDGHLPGAAFLDLERALSAPATAESGRHPLPDPGRLQVELRAVGVRTDRPVVVYDARDSLAAGRAWWVLCWAGLPDVRVLNGGLAGWQQAGGELVRGDAAPASGDVTVRVGAMPAVTVDDVARGTGRSLVGVLLDARAGARYRGEVEPLDPKAGHIPGAVNLPLARLQDVAGRFRSATELAAVFADVGIGSGATDPPVVASCGSGITACGLILAAAVTGRPMALYPGSFSQWSGQDRPVATGPVP